MSLQTLDRAILLLQRLGDAGERGLRLVDVQREMELARPTAHRLLTTLLDHGLIVRDEKSRTFRLGWELVVLGWSVPSPLIDLREVCEKAVDRVAQETGDTVILSTRSRLDTVCIERKAGSYPIKVFTVEVGARRPLGVGAGSIAVLATMGEEEMVSVLDTLKSRLKLYEGLSADAVAKAARAARRDGYAVSDGIYIPNVRGIGVAIRDGRGVAIGALGVAAIADRAPDRRLPEIGALLMREREAIEHRLRGRSMPRRSAQKRRGGAAPALADARRLPSATFR